MSINGINSVDDLKQYLWIAMQLEHATIPPYLTALYSIKEGANAEAVDVIRVVVVEEMLHLTLAANMLNAIGGPSDGPINLLADGFIPEYPTYLQDGEDWFKVSLQKFSLEALETFLNIEQPREAKSGRRSEPMLAASKDQGLYVARLPHKTIGDFYAEILAGFKKLDAQFPNNSLFPIDRHQYQVPDTFYYSGGGKLFPIYNLDDATRAINLISEQGEGYGGTIDTDENEIAHYYRFKQLLCGRYYAAHDDPAKAPSGPVLSVDFDAVHPIRANAKLSEYADAPDIRAKALTFIDVYRSLLGQLNQAFNGQPDLLVKAVHVMFEVKKKAGELMRLPLPDESGENAAPVFSLPKP